MVVNGCIGVVVVVHYNVQGTLALPVFEPSGQSCVGVLELIMTSQKVNYAPEVDKVCKVLEGVNLKSSEILDHQSTQACNSFEFDDRVSQMEQQLEEGRRERQRLAEHAKKQEEHIKKLEEKIDQFITQSSRNDSDLPPPP